MTLMPVSKTSTLVDCSTNVRRRRGGSARASWSRTGRAVVDRVADDVEDAAEALRADGHRDGRAGVAHLHAADEAVGRVHGDGAHGVLAEVLRDLEGRGCPSRVEMPGLVTLSALRIFGQLAGGELDVDDGADDLDDLAEAGGRSRSWRREERGLGHGARVYHGVNGSSMIGDGVRARIALAASDRSRAERRESPGPGVLFVRVGAGRARRAVRCSAP